MNFTDRVIQFIKESRLSDFPAEVVHQGKRCLLDALGAMIAGAETPVGRIMTDFAVSQYGGSEASILVKGKKASAVGAVLANGFAGNALDIDDGYKLVKGHPGACALPVVLASAEITDGTSGEDVLAAFIVGYEVGIRAGLIRHALYAEYHSSGSWGAIAGAAVAGKLMGFDAPTLRHAMGAAEYHAPIAPMMKCIHVPSMGKDSIGWGAMVGMSSALLAKEGFTGIEPLFTESPEKHWIEGLGDEFRIMDLYFKPYAACRWGQPAVAGALKVVRENGLNPASIKGINVRTFEEARQLPCTPPKDTEEAQYSLAFPVAAALLDGEVGPRQVLPPRLFDDDVLSLLSMVDVETDPEYDLAFPEKRFAEVRIHTNDGRVITSGPVEAIWDPPAALPTDRELEDKFRRLADPVLGGEKTDKLVNLIWSFDQTESAAALLPLCMK